MQRSGGSFNLQHGLASLRSGAGESPNSVSLSGLAALEGAQGSLTSNALFGSLNLEELMNATGMDQQGQQLLNSMRAAEAHQRAMQGGLLPQQHPTQQPQQQQQQQPEAHQQGPLSAAAPVPPFAGFPQQPADAQPQQQGRSADDIWRGLGVELGGNWNAPAQSPAIHSAAERPPHLQAAEQAGSNRSPRLAPNLGGYLPSGAGQHHAAAAAAAGRGGTLPGLSAQSGIPSLSSMGSTGLTHNMGGLGVGSHQFSSSGSVEVASQLASADGSAWYNQLGLQQQEAALAAARSAAGMPPGGFSAAAMHARLQHAAAAGAPGFSGGQQQQLNPDGLPGGALDPAGVRRGSYPGIGGTLSPRFSSHTLLPPPNQLYAASFPGADAHPALNPHENGGAFGRDASFSSAGGDYGRGMPPPPTLTVAGGSSRGAAAGSRDAGDASPDVLAAPPAARRSRSFTRTQSSGRSSQLAEDAAFPEIPAPVPRVRAKPQPKPEQLAPLSARERHKATKGKTLSVNEKELRDLKRKEANRESAARSRDKRLKLIADLEVEVRTLREQHQEFKEKIIESTVPRPLLTPGEAEQAKALRRVRTDPVECEAQIRAALVKEGLDLKQLAVLVPSAAPTASAAAAGANAAAAITTTAAPATGPAAVTS